MICGRRSAFRAFPGESMFSGITLLFLLLDSEAVPEGSWPSSHPVPGRHGWFSSVGNHRWVVQVDQLPSTACNAVRVVVPWRRRDSAPLSKDNFFVSAASHLRVEHCAREDADPRGESATFVFDANDGPGEYHLYFLPFQTCEYSGGACEFGADVEYTSNASRGCADGRWWNECNPTVASSVALQSRSKFASFRDEELVATKSERAAIAALMPASAPVVVVGEDRSRPIRMRRQVPYTWARLERLAEFSGSAQLGERYTFQLGVWAYKETVQLKSVAFSDLRMRGGDDSIRAALISCMNIQGTDYWGRPFHSSPTTLIDQVMPLWIAVRVPSTVAVGMYDGSAVLHFDKGSVVVSLAINIRGPAILDGGDSQAWRGTRLQWLDSDLAQAGDTVPPPYLPLSIVNHSPHMIVASMLDKRIQIGPDGLPWSIAVGTAAADFPQSNAIAAEALTSPVSMTLTSAGVPISLTPSALFQKESTNMSVAWTALLGAPGGIVVNVSGSLDCTGYLDYRLDITGAPHGSSINLIVPAEGLMAMGLGVKGDYLEHMEPAGGRSEWLVLDMGKSVTADAFGLYAVGDSVHDPVRMRLQIADTADGPWKPVAGFLGKPGISSQQVFPFGDQLQVTSRYWKWLIDSTVPSKLCAPWSGCQSWVAEVELRDARHGWIKNNGTGAWSIVVNSSGSTPGMDSWMAVDGVLTFVAGKNGWDARDTPSEPHLNKNIVADWKWDGVNGNNAVWVGTSVAGLRLFLKGADDLWQAAVPFDSKLTPTPPSEWDNDQSGGIKLFRNGTVIAYTGPLASATHTLRFSLMSTPVRPLDLPKHYKERYAQLGGAANYSFLAEQGATVVNMHQGNPVNPWINYPYSTNSLMRNAADACHAVGMRFKIYNTMRELSNHCNEIWAMLAFNETYVSSLGAQLPDVGHGADWLQEHIQYGYEVAWSNPVQNVYPGSKEKSAQIQNYFDHPLEQDAAIKVRALSRWNNYYVEGIRQMISDFGFDGLYLDEIAYDRVTMLRAKKVLGANGLIDHHSDQGGFTPSPAVNYLELFPFIDSLWYGEGFNYEDASPAYWLMEMSGLPHGLPADMLRYEGMTPQHFKGMLFASSNRWQCGLDGPVGSCPFDPRAVWQLWDEFGIQHATMWGWWLDKERGEGTVPILANVSQVKVTSYVRKGVATLLAIGSWLPHDSNVTLKINWDNLGLASHECELVAPRLLPMQEKPMVLPPLEPLSVPAGQGLLLIVRPKTAAEKMYG